VDKCDSCKEFGMRYCRLYPPEDFLEGKRSSRYWIVGLNPKAELDHQDERGPAQLPDFFEARRKEDPYFKDFRKVSMLLHDKLGMEEGVAHTDIVKCFSKTFPPQGVSRSDALKIVDNCARFFKMQLSKHGPQLIVCNGSYACEAIKQIIPPTRVFGKTRYAGEYNGLMIQVILSGFIGRIDDYAKARLGSEIDGVIRELEDRADAGNSGGVL
jgi:uracil-DNA glycosylase